MTFDTEKLIREIESRKAIWDISSDEYSDRDLKRRQWEEITNIMCEENLSENEKNTFRKSLQQKWKNIRTRFSKELKRIAGAKSESAASRKSPYIFFQQLQFLRETVVNNVTEASINETDDDEGNEGDNVQIRLPVTKKKKTNEDESFIEVLKESVSEREDRERNQESESDILFLLSLLGEFRKIPEHRWPFIKNKLMGVINEYRYGSEVSNNITMDNSQYHHGYLLQKNDGLGAYAPGASNSGQYCHENSTQRNYGPSSGASNSVQNPRVYSTPVSDKQNCSTIDYDEGLSRTDSDVTTVQLSVSIFRIN